MPQRMRRHSLPDPGGLGGGVDGAVELTVESGSIGCGPETASPRQQYAAAPAFSPPITQQLKHCGDSIASASLRPLPCSTRNSMRSESMSPTLSATTSETRSPAP